MVLVEEKPWWNTFAAALSSVSDEMLLKVAWKIAASDLILVAGNGGSSAIASHAAQAISKPDYKAGGGRPAICLTDNIPSLTAHANDGGWERALVECAKPFFETVNECCLFAISSSGKSSNIVKLVEAAREAGVSVISMTGFEGEPLRSFSSFSLHVDSDDYEIIEPLHDLLLHRIQRHLRIISKSA